jgi:hypothetical protein
MTPELSDDDKAILAVLLRETIERDRFPLSPRVRSFKGILAKLDPPAPRPKAARRAQHGADEEAAAVGHAMLFPRLRSGRRRARGIDPQYVKLVLATIAAVILVTQLWFAFVDRMPSTAGSN